MFGILLSLGLVCIQWIPNRSRITFTSFFILQVHICSPSVILTFGLALLYLSSLDRKEP